MSTVKLDEISQICMVVRDLNKSMETMWGQFGIGPWDVYQRSEHISAHSRKKVGAIEIELVQPTSAESLYHSFLKEHGESVNHLQLSLESEGAFIETTRALEALGFPCLRSGRSNYARFAFYDTTRALATMLEVVWHHAGSRPKPDRVYPDTRRDEDGLTSMVH